MFAVALAAWISANPVVGAGALRTDEPLRLGPFLEVRAEAANQALSPEDAFSDNGFSAGGEEASFGPGQHILWARFRTEPGLGPVLLRAGHPRPQRIDVYSRRSNGEVISTGTMDLGAATAKRSVLLELALPLDPEAQEHAVRLDARPARINLELLSAARAPEIRQRESLWMGLYYGIFAGLLLYNLFFGIALRDGVYLLYCAGQLSFVAHVAVRDGLAPWPMPASLFARGASIAIATLLMLAFARSFLELPVRRRRYDGLVKGAIAVQAVVAVAALAGLDVYGVAVALVIPSLLLVIIAAADLARTGDRAAGWLLFAWGIFIASAFWNVALALGFVDGGLATRYGLKIGSAIEMIVLSVAVASRLEDLREEKERAERALADTRVRVQVELARRLIETQEAERTRFARELHDGLGHALLLVKERLLAAARRSDQINTADAEALAAETQLCIDDARAMARNLVPPSLERLGLPGALQAVAEELTARTGVRVDVDSRLGAESGMEGAIHLFRIAQEAMANAIRHADASRVVVRLQERSGELILSIDDDGKGFDTRASRGLGLLDMEQRARIVGGTFELRSARGSGTHVSCRIPLVPREPSEGHDASMTSA